MRFLKYFAIIALAAVPLRLLDKARKPQIANAVDSDEIFQVDLKAD